jgi:transcriptional regulator with XRE-family HTH domain
MITVLMVTRIKELLAFGRLSRRAIARLCGVNHETVNRIARGQCTGKQPEPTRVEGIRCLNCGVKLNLLPCVKCGWNGDTSCPA